jgi:hypothetical protein
MLPMDWLADSPMVWPRIGLVAPKFPVTWKKPALA